MALFFFGLINNTNRNDSMSIKNQKPKKGLQWKQGFYKPINPQKYIGIGDIIYRSSWEEKFCIYCDKTDAILAWSIEPQNHIIPYISALDQKERKYNPDFYIKVKKDNGYKEYLVEVKPSKQLNKPKRPKVLTKKAMKTYKYLMETYARNISKYKYAKIYAQKREMGFLIVTEKWIKKEMMINK